MTLRIDDGSNYKNRSVNNANRIKQFQFQKVVYSKIILSEKLDDVLIIK